MHCSMFFCSERVFTGSRRFGGDRLQMGDWEEGQATVEAALLIPVVMVCIALLVQPACLLYTRAVMEAAAAEACRLVSTTPSTVGTADQAYRAYVLRRLSAVPDADLFHRGGREGWRITMEGATASHGASVTIETSVRPLPVLGVLPALLGKTDGNGDIVVRVEVVTTTRADWVEGDYGVWAGLWD